MAPPRTSLPTSRPTSMSIPSHTPLATELIGTIVQLSYMGNQIITLILEGFRHISFSNNSTTLFVSHRAGTRRNTSHHRDIHPTISILFTKPPGGSRREIAWVSHSMDSNTIIQSTTESHPCAALPAGTHLPTGRHRDNAPSTRSQHTISRCPLPVTQVGISLHCSCLVQPQQRQTRLKQCLINYWRRAKGWSLALMQSTAASTMMHCMAV